MKKLAVSFLFFVRSFALFVGNPDVGIPEKSFSGCDYLAGNLGYVRDWISDQDMCGIDIGGSFNKFGYVVDEGTIALVGFDRFAVFGNLGASTFGVEQRVGGVNREYHTGHRLTWGIGGKLVIFETEKFALGMNGLYQAASPRFKWIGTDGAPAVSVGNSRLDWSMWQVGLLGTYAIDFFHPYLGVKYANAEATFRNLPDGFFADRNQFKVRSGDKFGMVIGLTLSTDAYFQFTVEARVIDEEALSMNLSLRF